MFYFNFPSTQSPRILRWKARISNPQLCRSFLPQLEEVTAVGAGIGVKSSVSEADGSKDVQGGSVAARVS